METLESLIEKRRAAKAQVDHYLQECDGHPSILNPLSRVAYLSAVREEERLIEEDIEREEERLIQQDIEGKEEKINAEK